MNQSLFSVVLLVCVVTVVAHVTLNISENQEYKSNQINDESIYYFGKSGIQINDGSCYVNHFKCLNNPNDMIQQFTALTPYDCCKSCLNNTKCVAYNHLYINATTNTQYIINNHPQCQLFSTFPNDTDHVYSGNCVMGTPYDKSSYAQRPNFVFYFPDTFVWNQCRFMTTHCPRHQILDNLHKEASHSTIISRNTRNAVHRETLCSQDVTC
eukprot:211358_1